MANPITHALEPLKQAGLAVEVDGRYVLVTDDALGFSREHNGLAGLRQFVQDTLDEYKVALEDENEEPWELSPEYQAAELPQEETVNFAERILSLMGIQPVADEEFAPAPPVKEHRLDQLELAKEHNSCKEIAQATEVDDQDRGGVPNPEGYITEMKLEAPAVVVLVRGHTYHAPDGWKIKEAQPNHVFYHGSINIGRKKNHELRGSRFSLVRG